MLKSKLSFLTLFSRTLNVSLYLPSPTTFGIKIKTFIFIRFLFSFCKIYARVASLYSLDNISYQIENINFILTMKRTKNKFTLNKIDKRKSDHHCFYGENVFIKSLTYYRFKLGCLTICLYATHTFFNNKHSIMNHSKYPSKWN